MATNDPSLARTAFQFSLRDLLLFFAAVSVTLGVCRWNLAVGVAVGLTLLGILTVFAGIHGRRRGPILVGALFIIGAVLSIAVQSLTVAKWVGWHTLDVHVSVVDASTLTPSSLAHEVEEFVGDVNDKIRRLESIIERIPLYGRDRKTATSRPGVTLATTASRKVFVVHGRNNELKETVARYLTQLDLAPVILHEQASAGLTVIEKFEVNSDACFAVILLTPDDVGCLSPAQSLDTLSKRARQNVIFEWGFFVAKLGRRNVCALVAEGVEIPSDMGGIVYVSLDQHGAWKMLLARELKAGKVEIDLNGAI